MLKGENRKHLSGEELQMFPSKMKNFTAHKSAFELTSLLTLLLFLPQQSEQREQQRLALQRLPLPLPHLPLPLPRLLLLLLGAAPADARPPLFGLLPRLRLHLSGRFPVQVAVTHAPGHPTGSNEAHFHMSVFSGLLQRSRDAAGLLGDRMRVGME